MDRDKKFTAAKEISLRNHRKETNHELETLCTNTVRYRHRFGGPPARSAGDGEEPPSGVGNHECCNPRQTWGGDGNPTRHYKHAREFGAPGHHAKGDSGGSPQGVRAADSPRRNAECLSR